MSATLGTIETQASALQQMASACVVTTDAELQAAGESLKLVKAYLARVAEVFDPIDRAQIEARRVTIAQRKGLEKYALDAEILIKTRMASYQRGVEASRRAEAEAAAMRARQEEETRRLEAAVAAEQAGDGQAAARILDTPTPVMVAPVAPATKVEGVSFGESWSAEVTDMLALVKAVAAGTQPLHYLKADLVALNQAARAARGTLAVPGVQSVRANRVTVRA